MFAFISHLQVMQNAIRLLRAVYNRVTSKMPLQSRLITMPKQFNTVKFFSSVASIVGNTACAGFLTAALLVCLPLSLASAQFSVSLSEDMVLDNDGLILATSGNFSFLINGAPYQQEVLLSHGGYQFATWYRNGADQDIMIGRRELTGNVWEIFDTGENMEIGNLTWDSHNVISMGISGDGRIHLSYDHHVHPLRYLTSAPGFATTSSSNWNASGFSAERNRLNLGGATIPRITYPRFANVGDDLVFTYRDFGSGNGDHLIADYDSTTGLWSSTRFMARGRGTGQTYDDVINSPSSRRNSYHNGFHADNTGRLHTTWNWRESTQDGNHDIHYAYSDDFGVTWRNNDDQLVGTNASPITLNSNVEIVDLDRTHALLNQQGQVVDAEGGVHVLMFHRPPGHSLSGSPFSDRSNSDYHHYYRDPATGLWEDNVFPAGTAVGSRPRMAVDSSGNVFGIYTEGDDLVIAGALNDADGYDWVVLRRDQTHDYDGTPQVDLQRLMDDGILSIYIQEEGANRSATNPSSSTLRVLEFSLETPPPFEPGVLIAGWDTWDSSGVHAADVTDGTTTGTTSSSGFSLDSDLRANTDGTWGTFDTPMADVTADESSDAARLVNGSSGYYEFTVTDTSGLDRDLTTFHFDAGTLRPNSARNFELSVVSGDLTVGTVATGVVPSLVGGVQDWSDFDISLAGLADRTLDANGTVTFRLEFTGGTVGAGGHHQGLDNVAVAAEPPVLPITLIAGWDNFENAATPSVTTSLSGVTATVAITGSGWSNNDSSGRGSSNDTSWGTFEGPPVADAGTTAVGANLALINGAATGDLTFTVTNSGLADIDLNSFHMDALAFRPNAARTYALNVLSGDMTVGNVFTSDGPSSDNTTNAITHLGGALLTDDSDPLTHDQHDDIEIDMSGLADHTLAVGESAVIQIAFTGGTGGGGHHLFVDNVAFGGVVAGAGVLLGDVDLNGVVNFADIPAFIAVLSGGRFQAEADCDENGTVNFLDIPAFIAILSGA